jgi:hypothetical protein
VKVSDDDWHDRRWYHVPMLKDPRREELAAKLRTALDMFGLGESIMRQNLRRKYPEASEAEIEDRLNAWLRERPGAEHGDAPGRLRDLPK